MADTGNRHRVIALVGPQSSGKTCLIESILSLTGKLSGKGQGRQFGDTSPEAKAREMGIDLNFAATEFMGDPYTFIDCPGAIELLQDTLSILNIVDAAVVVTEPDVDRILGLSPLLKHLEKQKIPHYLFINKIDRANLSLDALVTALNDVTGESVVLRQIPIYENDAITGYVDLASGRAHVYKPGAPSEIIDIPGSIQDTFQEARFNMLETLADYDEHLMEELLEDIDPPKDEVFKDLSEELERDEIIPVFLGSALNNNGVHRLLKAIRHEAPFVADVSQRLGVADRGPAAFVAKTLHTSHAGKLSLARILRGKVQDGDTFGDARVSGMVTLHGDTVTKTKNAEAGDFVGLGRMETIRTGDLLTPAGTARAETVPAPLKPVFGLALQAANRNDEVKMADSLAKLCDEDPSLIYDHVQDTGETVLRGQGEIHLKIAADRLMSKYGLKVETHTPQVPYKETIRTSAKQHYRYKKQSGGHGQYGDVIIEIAPLTPGTGFAFEERIHGGAIPRQYIPSVEHGVKEYLTKGPLGFPVVDVGVTLVDGGYHTVDSSDMAFKTAGRLAMNEAMPGCKPVLLEPIMHVKIQVPSDFTPKINALISGRRGQILGFDALDGWDGWDQVEAHMPQAEIQDMIIELRSMTLGAGTFTSEFDHLSQLTGRLADQVLGQAAAAE
ncbi:MAG: elongation factor G [Alphaproteobacteria bacterium]|nr:MAG: elongation factor G [Alphaproteobacteria bacterium]